MLARTLLERLEESLTRLGCSINQRLLLNLLSTGTRQVTTEDVHFALISSPSNVTWVGIFTDL